MASIKNSFLSACIAVFCIIVPVVAMAQVKIDLNEGWRFRKANSSDPWQNATVPGSVHADLLACGQIPDPFSGCNLSDIEWVERESWEYTLLFRVDKTIGDYKQLMMVFEGIDTHADVYLNGKKILTSTNMFVSHKIDVSNLVNPINDNELRVVFHPASDYVAQQAKKLDYKLPGGDWAYIRKAAFQFGWDFAPRLATCGIWQPVYLHTVNEPTLYSGSITTTYADSLNANLLATYNIISPIDKSVTLKVVAANDWQTIHSEQVKIKKGENRIQIPFSIQYPLLWWPNGMGKQYLYDLAIALDDDDNQQFIAQKVGVRKVELINEPDKHGTSFLFKINGKPLFAKGSNIVPPHSYLPALANEWVRLVADARHSNMNMLRVWGGGIYPPDQFYRACDSLGILVWQDFMFACSMYPWDEEFAQSVKIEANQQVERLSKFTSLAIWCGNNEIDEGWHNWGWQEELNDSIRVVEVWEGYQKIFHNVLAQTVKDYDSTLFYWPSSPQYGWGRAESLNHGDSHYWGVWWGKEPFDKYREKVPRFMSEYGFQGFPTLNSVMRFGGEFAEPTQPVLSCHQKHPVGFETIDIQMKREGFDPQSIKQRVYFSQITQAIGYRTAIESHRLASPRCMGTLYWQLNDCWPAISWSGIDYWGKWKAMHYQAKRSYEPIIVSAEFRGSRIVVRAVSDFPFEVEADVIVNIFTPQGKKLGVWKNFITLVPNVAVKAIDERLFDDPESKRPMIAVAQLVSDTYTSYFGIAVNEKWIDLKLKDPLITYEIVEEKGVTYIELKSKGYAFFVELSSEKCYLALDDNYFHMIPGRKYRVKLIDGTIDGLQVKSIWNYINGL